jgi:hypothetical protein
VADPSKQFANIMANLDVRKIRGSDAMTFALMPASGHLRRFNNVHCRSVMPLLAALVADMFDQQLRAINGSACSPLTSLSPLRSTDS